VRVLAGGGVEQLSVVTQHDRVVDRVGKGVEHVGDAGAGGQQRREAILQHLPALEQRGLAEQDRAVHRLGHLDPGNRTMQRDERKVVAARLVDHRARHLVHRRAELDDESGQRGARKVRDVAALALLPPWDVRPVGEQQLAAFEDRRHVRVFAGMHPADRARELRLAGEDLRDAFADGGQRQCVADRHRWIGR
jgi:hypothetical protein